MKEVKVRQYVGLLLTCGLFVGGGAMSVLGVEKDDGMKAALQLQQAFTKVAESASPAVVVITNKQVRRSPRLGREIPPEFRFFFGIPEFPEGRDRSRQVPTPAGRGSGVIIRPDGVVVTNAHVIENNDILEVKLHDGRVFSTDDKDRPVEVVGTDKDTDLAVLRLGGGQLTDLPTLVFADSDKAKVGEWAIAVGAPFNFDYSVTVGVVSQKGRYDVRMNTYENYLQTDASINPGNSGGPLLNLNGEVIGINDFIVTGGGFSRGNVGVGFAIASNLVRQVVDDIVETGAVIRPWLGIVMQPLTPELREQFDAEHGVLISDVVEGDPADKAGLKAGDVILRVGDRDVFTPHDVQFAVLQYKPGEELHLLIDRQGERTIVSVVPRRKDSKATATSGIATSQDLLEKLGLVVQDADDGVAITGVSSGSAADAAALHQGDLILEVNRTEVSTVDDVLEALRQTRNDVAVLYIERRGRKFFVTLPVTSGSDDDD